MRKYESVIKKMCKTYRKQGLTYDDVIKEAERAVGVINTNLKLFPFLKDDEAMMVKLGMSEFILENKESFEYYMGLNLFGRTIMFFRQNLRKENK